MPTDPTTTDLMSTAPADVSTTVTGGTTESQRAAAGRVRDLFTELGITETDFVAAHGTISAERAHSKLHGITPLSSLDYAVAAQLCIDRGRRVTVDRILSGAPGTDPGPAA